MATKARKARIVAGAEAAGKKIKKGAKKGKKNSVF